MASQPGPVALVGSGEFLPVMEPVDAGLLSGRPGRAVVIPTAAALEGDARVAYWIDLAQRHYDAMGVEAVPLDVRSRRDAEDDALVALVEGAGLIYLSGGDPHHLADTLRQSPLWHAIVTAWHHGAALAGCSAGAMALTSGAPERLLAPGGGPAPAQTPDRQPNGLGVVGGVAVIPHFDQMERWRVGALESFAAWQPQSTTLVGIEEQTALVGAADSGWRVEGRGTVWLLEDGRREPFRSGDAVPLPPPPR
jgi:cyanophycinase